MQDLTELEKNLQGGKMFDFIEGKRYLGEFEIVRKCEKRRIKIDFKSLFSFEVERIENDTITVKI